MNGRSLMRRRVRSVVEVLGVVVMLLWICIWWGKINIVEAELNPVECKEERKLGGNACQPVLYGKSPSAECCERVRVTHVECICPYISPKVASVIRSFGLQRLIKMIEACGRPLPHKAKCGSITIP